MRRCVPVALILIALALAGCGSGSSAVQTSPPPSPSEPAPGSPLGVAEEAYITAVASRSEDLKEHLNTGLASLDDWPDATSKQELEAIESRSRLQAMAETKAWGDAPTARMTGLEVAWEAAVSEAQSAVSSYILSIQSDDPAQGERELETSLAALKRVTERLAEANAIIDELRR